MTGWEKDLVKILFLCAVHTLSFRYYFLLDSYSKLMEACMDVGASSDKWLSRLTISSWLTHIKEILNCGCLIAQVLEKVHFFFSLLQSDPPKWESHLHGIIFQKLGEVGLMNNFCFNK